MSRVVSPLMRTAGFKRKGQAFTKDRNDRNAHLDFQKDRYNTRDHVSFTINLGVVSPRAVEEHLKALCGAITYWARRDILMIPTGGQWGGRIGQFLGTGDYWWSFETRLQMEGVAESVVSALRGRALPLIESWLDRPLTFPSYVIETEGNPSYREMADDGEVTYHNVGGKRLWPLPEGTASPPWVPGGPDLVTPPHTWPVDGGPPGLVAWIKSAYPS